MSEHLSYSRDGEVGRIVFSNPPVNAFTLATIRDLDRVLEEIREDAPGIVLLESDIDGTFSAGGDVNWLADQEPETLRRFTSVIHKTFRTIETIPTLFVAAIDGNCLAGGFELALACDMRFAADGDFALGLTEADIGSLPGGGGPKRLSQELGRGTAIELIVDATRLSPAEAYDLGLVQKLYDPDEFDAALQRYVDELTEGSTQAYGAAKLAVTNGLNMSTEEALAYENILASSIRHTDEYQERHAEF